MSFGKVTTADRPVIERFVCTTGENNCETAYINMLVWQGLYDVSFCAQEDALIVRASHEAEETVRRLSAMCEPCPAAFPLMTSEDVGDKTIEFPHIMQ